MLKISDIIPEGNIIALSPHYDDIVLSWGGYFDALVRDGCRSTKKIRIVNFFSRSNYQARDDDGNEDTSQKRIQFASGVRLIEDLTCLDDLIGHGHYICECAVL